MSNNENGAPAAPGSTPPPPGSQPGGLEAPLPPSADPTKKTTHTSDPQADDPGNGAD
jgi:hypothetical protein